MTAGPFGEPPATEISESIPMTEAEWFDCSDPLDMGDHLGDGWRPRHRVLFACACLRRLWEVLPEPAHRAAIEVAERFLDGDATPDDLVKARAAAYRTYEGIGDIVADYAAMTSSKLCAAWGRYDPWGRDGVEGMAAIAAEAWHDDPRSWGNVYAAEQAAQCALLRDVVGNPFRPVAFDPAWATELVRSLATGVIEARRLPEGTFDPERLAILADALEDASCADAAILTHLRGPGPHVRGCWVVEQLLGKS